MKFLKQNTATITTQLKQRFKLNKHWIPQYLK